MLLAETELRLRGVSRRCVRELLSRRATVVATRLSKATIKYYVIDPNGVVAVVWLARGTVRVRARDPLALDEVLSAILDCTGSTTA